MTYEKVNESNESLLPSSTDSDVEWRPKQQHRGWILTALNVVLFIVSLSLFTARFFDFRSMSEVEMMKKTSFYCTFVRLPVGYA